LDFSVFLNQLTWSTTSAYKYVVQFIATDPIPPACTGPGEGLRKPKVDDQVLEEIRMINEPAVPIGN
jgi:hypothetical protein